MPYVFSGPMRLSFPPLSGETPQVFKSHVYGTRPRWFEIIFYLTAPVIPSVNCFCRTKKMIIVGMEQKSTPSIRTP